MSILFLSTLDLLIIISAVNDESFQKDMGRLARKYRAKSHEDSESMAISELFADIIQAWGEVFLPKAKQYGNIVRTYHDLRKESFPFKEQYNENRAPIFTPPPAIPEDTGYGAQGEGMGYVDEDAALAAALAASLEMNSGGASNGRRGSGSRSDSTPQRNRSDSGSINRRQSTGKKSKDSNKDILESCRASSDVLRDMVLASSTAMDVCNNDIIDELCTKLKSSQSNLAVMIETALINDASEVCKNGYWICIPSMLFIVYVDDVVNVILLLYTINAQGVVELFELNDSLGSLLDIVSGLKSGKLSMSSAHSQLQKGSTSADNAPSALSENHLGKQPSSLTGGNDDPFSIFNQSSTPMKSASTSASSGPPTSSVALDIFGDPISPVPAVNTNNSNTSSSNSVMSTAKSIMSGAIRKSSVTQVHEEVLGIHAIGTEANSNDLFADFGKSDISQLLAPAPNVSASTTTYKSSPQSQTMGVPTLSPPLGRSPGISQNVPGVVNIPSSSFSLPPPQLVTNQMGGNPYLQPQPDPSSFSVHNYSNQNQGGLSYFNAGVNIQQNPGIPIQQTYPNLSQSINYASPNPEIVTNNPFDSFPSSSQPHSYYPSTVQPAGVSFYEYTHY